MPDASQQRGFNVGNNRNDATTAQDAPTTAHALFFSFCERLEAGKPTIYKYCPEARPIDDRLNLALLNPSAHNPTNAPLLPLREALNRQAQRTPASQRAVSYSHYSNRFKARAQPLKEARQQAEQERAQERAQVRQEAIKPAIRRIMELTAKRKISQAEQEELTALRLSISPTYKATLTAQQAKRKAEFNALIASQRASLEAHLSDIFGQEESQPAPINPSEANTSD